MSGFEPMPEGSHPRQDGGSEADRRRTRRLLIAAVAVVCVLAAAPVLVGVRGSHRRSDYDLSAGALIGVLAAVVALLAATTMLLWHLFNRPAYQRAMQYHRRRRSRIAKALRRGKPINPEDLEVAGALVEVMQKQRVFLWFQPLMIASWILMAVTRHGVGRWLYAGLALVTVPVLAYGVRMQQRVRRNWEAASAGSAGGPHDPV
jgi:hypothetical protein